MSRAAKAEIMWCANVWWCECGKVCEDGRYVSAVAIGAGEKLSPSRQGWTCSVVQGEVEQQAKIQAKWKLANGLMSF